MAGDFNAHTGTASEGSHLHTVRPSPPPRWGDPSPNHQPRRGAGSSPGDLLLDVLEETNGIIVTNRFRSTIGGSAAGSFTRLVRWETAAGMQESVLDYFLMPAEWFHIVKAEGIVLASGNLLDESCEHEFLWMDIDPYLSPKSPKRSVEGVQWYAPIKRASYGTKELAEDIHSTQSKQASLWPDLPPKQAYRAALRRYSQELTWLKPRRKQKLID